MRVLIVAAVPGELGDLEGEAVGVGPVRAGVGAARALARVRPDAVVLLGSAGAFPGGPAVGEVVVARRLGLSRGIAELDAGYVPLAPGVIEADPALAGAFAAPAADVLTVEAVTTDDVLAAARGRQWQVEHMESYAVATAAAAAGVRFAAVLGIANPVGPQAHATWLREHARAEEAARAVVRRWRG